MAFYIYFVRFPPKPRKKGLAGFGFQMRMLKPAAEAIVPHLWTWPRSRPAGRGLSAPAFVGGSASSGSDGSGKEKGKLLELRGGKGCVTGKEGTGDCRVGLPATHSITGAARAAWEKEPRPSPDTPSLPGCLLASPAGWCGRRRLERVAPPRGGQRAGRGGAPSSWLQRRCGRALAESARQEQWGTEPS